MISVSKAIEKIKGTIKELNPIEVVLTEANGCCLAEDIFAPIDMPPFDQSAMDGYAVCEGVGADNIPPLEMRPCSS